MAWTMTELSTTPTIQRATIQAAPNCVEWREDSVTAVGRQRSPCVDTIIKSPATDRTLDR